MKSRNDLSTTNTKVLMAMIALAALLAVAAGCSPAKWRESELDKPSPKTGDEFSERRTAQGEAPAPKAGERRYVTSDRVPARTSCGQSADEAPLLLETNDVVEILAPADEDGCVQVTIVGTKSGQKPEGPHFIPDGYLSPNPVDSSDEDRYIIIQNIATRKLRVYERCANDAPTVAKLDVQQVNQQSGQKPQVQPPVFTREECANRLILETDMVVGQDSDGRRSLLGSYKIKSWFKFYEDNQKKYPSWHHPKYPKLPDAGASLEDWSGTPLLPEKYNEKRDRGTRGAFGWYTAVIEPNAEGQWTHGTWGWGKDGEKFIQALFDPQYSENPLVASHGCSRVENQAIAYMREMLPPGTRLIKIYAAESERTVRGAEKATPTHTGWEWILTDEGVDAENGPKASRHFVEMTKVGAEHVLERGNYTVDNTPDAVDLEHGNAYGIDEDAFQGTFLVDEGRLVGYAHPKGLEVGGHRNRHLPSDVISTKPLVPKANRKPAKPAPIADDRDSGDVVNE